MTIDAHPVAELPNPADYGFTVIERDDLPAELSTLVERVRALVDTVAHTEADPAELAEASRTVEELTERLGARSRAVGTMIRQTWEDGRVDYNTVANAVVSRTNPVAPLRELHLAGGELRGEATLSGAYEGPPGLAHGGWVAALLDQVLGEVSALRGHVGLTGNLTVDYRRPTPLGTPLTVAARVTGVEGRKMFVAGEIRCDGEVTAEGRAVMVRLTAPPRG